MCSVDLYLASVEPQLEREVFLAVRNFTPAGKLARIQRCRIVQQRATMLLAEALLKWGLVKRGLPEALSWSRHESEYGKPFLRPQGVDSSRPVEFNISHSGRWALVGIDEAPVGVDIQEHRHIDELLARRILPRQVYELFGDARQDDKDALFCDWWARRESELKWSGAGIVGSTDSSVPLSIEVSVRNVSCPRGFSAAVCGRGLPVGVMEPEIISTDQLLG